ncbi:MAG TPA: PP2C family protein-serine/threonine phosphatase [Candidatus Eisenbacteria bacterium]|nr:PP2C family protein-serine/threonine phosphatase [Candidatus Eisenbacteria bacterium]
MIDAFTPLAGGDALRIVEVGAGATAERGDLVIVVRGASVARVVLDRGAQLPSTAAAARALHAGLQALADEADRRAQADLAAEASLARATRDAARLEQELRIARRIQRSLVQLATPAVEGWEVACDYRPARQIGGDFFDVFPVPPGPDARHLALVIADVSGKGISAALLMAFIRPVVRAALDRTNDPVEALERTNRILVGERRTGLFVTILAALLDLESGSLRIANAGHEAPLLVPAGRGRIRWLPDGGPLIGAFPKLGLTESKVELGPGDQLVLYTDGVTDATDPGGRRFGDERLRAVVGRNRTGTAEELVGAIDRSVTRFQGDADAADDLALLVLRRVPPAPASRESE